MRRIYIESFVGLVLFFIASLATIEVVIYQLNTDYDYVLADYQAEAWHDLIEVIYQHEGDESAVAAVEKYAQKTRQILTKFSTQELPSDISQFFFHDHSQAYTFHDNDRNLWFRVNLGSDIYQLKPDLNTPLRQAINFNDNITLIFLLVGFALYCVVFIWFLSRRVRALEKVTLAFASGDLTARASIDSNKRVGSLNRSFNFMADKISDLVTSNKALTNAIAHELRTPIFRIQWQAEMLADYQLTPKQATKVASIIEDTEEMETMVNELLYYAKVERPESELNIQPIPLNSWLEPLLDKWRTDSSNHIEYTQPKTLFTLTADPYLLKRALDNLLGNAQKYAQGKIGVSLSLSPDNKQLLICVHDDGRGIEEKHWPFIFDAFYSADSSRGEKHSGFGLGLAIVKQVVLRHHGKVSVSTSPLGGACFTISLPYSK
ncbi:ATP-binding protein [Vibrio aestuarianus]|uniref:ATP-binding protein n=1 Tax=Vibrio aestuarianus TaxID=28171 RepID=UPI00237C89F9|nr:ATP-binding protein [Vibrio aestuarianus]MDE1253434.1 ATP-binding protein [Vibrio aestuarianus]